LREVPIYLELVYLVTTLVPPETVCLVNYPGRRRRAVVWILRAVMVDLLLSGSLSSNALEDVTDKRVHDAHGLGGDASIRVDLLLIINLFH